MLQCLFSYLVMKGNHVPFVSCPEPNLHWNLSISCGMQKLTHLSSYNLFFERAVATHVLIWRGLQIYCPSGDQVVFQFSDRLKRHASPWLQLGSSGAGASGVKSGLERLLVFDEIRPLLLINQLVELRSLFNVCKTAFFYGMAVLDLTPLLKSAVVASLAFNMCCHWYLRSCVH